MSGEEMQTKIATARRDAEGLKDKIKRRKDELADTSRESSNLKLLMHCLIPSPAQSLPLVEYRLTMSSPNLQSEAWRRATLILWVALV